MTRYTFEIGYIGSDKVKVNDNINVVYNEKLRNCTVKTIYSDAIIVMDHTSGGYREFKTNKTKIVKM